MWHIPRANAFTQDKRNGGFAGVRDRARGLLSVLHPFPCPENYVLPLPLVQ